MTSLQYVAGGVCSRILSAKESVVKIQKPILLKSFEVIIHAGMDSFNVESSSVGERLTLVFQSQV